MENDKKTYSVTEVAAQLGIGRNQAYEAVRRGQIPSLRIGTRIVVPKTAFENWLANSHNMSEVSGIRPAGSQ
ncbi:MAG: helix-turn-helix domain-containing protein [Alphaproteobacteria bacterium]|nr:helix-turn-helix domain-containing protein [Alphaproteobacteria bacterium]